MMDTIELTVRCLKNLMYAVAIVRPAMQVCLVLEASVKTVVSE
jgi:hypothetical protein